MADLAAWLAAHGLSVHLSRLAENDVDMDVLPELTEADLREMDFSVGERKRVMVAVRTLADTGAVQAPDDRSSVGGAEAARRQVTVLFVDLSGFTSLSTRLDAEEVHALLQRYFAVADEVVRDYGGSIDKHIGDAVMAVFGAPVAHTDDPERAARTALEIHRRLAEFTPPLNAHIGIASGQVVASLTGSASFEEYTVTGASVNLAARLQDLAGPNETLISDAVRDALGARARTEAYGDAQVKGIEGPVRIWRLHGVEVDAGAGSDVGPFVGRTQELRRLRGALAGCLAAESGHIVFLRGEPGIGKTRLADRFRQEAEAENFVCHTGLVLDFRAGKGRDALPALVRSLLGIPIGSGKAERRKAAEQALADGLVATGDAVHAARGDGQPPGGGRLGWRRASRGRP